MPEKRETRVLIVEDMPVIAEYFCTVLSDVFLVEVEMTAMRAMDRLERKHPVIDVVLLDLHLPNGQGLALVREFQGKYPEIPLVVVTGYDYDYEDMIEAGAQEFLRKPYTSQRQLVEALLHGISRHRVRRVFAPLDAKCVELQRELEESQNNFATLTQPKRN